MSPGNSKSVLMVARHPTGGIRTFFKYIYSRPEFSDFQLTLIAPGADLRDYLETQVGRDRIRLIQCHDSIWAVLKTLLGTCIRERRFDLYHSHGFTAGIVIEVARLVRPGMVHLMTAHDVFRAEQFAGFKGWCKKTLMSLLYRRVQCIHTVTGEAGDNFRSFFPAIPDVRFQSILHGVDTDYFSQGAPRELGAEFSLPENRLRIGFFGRFMAQKGFRDLVDAMVLIRDQGQLQELPVVLTFGWGGFIREDYAYVAEKGLQDSFFQLPQTNDMPGSIKAVDLVVMPSRWEACGLLAMEVLAAGKPLIASSCVGLNEVVQGTPAHIVDPESPEQLAQAIVAMTASGSSIPFADYQPVAVREFSIQRPAAAIARLYERLSTSGRIESGKSIANQTHH